MAQASHERPDPSDFWDLEDLVPPKKPRVFSPALRANTDAADVTAPPKTTVYTAGGFSPIVDIPLTDHPVVQKTPAAPKAPDMRYRPAASLLLEVRLYRSARAADYYERFSEMAHDLFSKEGQECPVADFYSYMPQYAQLTPAQLDTYLWWRTNFRRGNAIAVPYPYLLLYLYEIIHLDDLMDPRETQAAMLRLWKA